MGEVSDCLLFFLLFIIFYFLFFLKPPPNQSGKGIVFHVALLRTELSRSDTVRASKVFE